MTTIIVKQTYLSRLISRTKRPFQSSHSSICITVEDEGDDRLFRVVTFIDYLSQPPASKIGVMKMLISKNQMYRPVCIARIQLDSSSILRQVHLGFHNAK